MDRAGVAEQLDELAGDELRPVRVEDEAGGALQHRPRAVAARVAGAGGRAASRAGAGRVPRPIELAQAGRVVEAVVEAPRAVVVEARGVGVAVGGERAGEHAFVVGVEVERALDEARRDLAEQFERLAGAAGLAEQVGACEQGHVAEQVVTGFGGEREDAVGGGEGLVEPVLPSEERGTGQEGMAIGVQHAIAR